jgi:hypothetical protein
MPVEWRVEWPAELLVEWPVEWPVELTAGLPVVSSVYSVW